MTSGHRRPRRRARDIANLPKKGNVWFMVGLVMVGLSLVLGLKWTMGDSTSAAFQSIAGDPELELPSGPTDDEFEPEASDENADAPEATNAAGHRAADTGSSPGPPK